MTRPLPPERFHLKGSEPARPMQNRVPGYLLLAYSCWRALAAAKHAGNVEDAVAALWMLLTRLEEGWLSLDHEGAEWATFLVTASCGRSTSASC